MMVDDTPLAPKGATVQESFCLMMHDRILALERAVGSMQRGVTDQRVMALGHSTVSSTGAVFIRLRTPEVVTIGRLVESVLRRLGARTATRWDLWACQHWSLGMGDKPHVTEMLVQRSGQVPVDIYHVAHAVLDSLDSVTAQMTTAAQTMDAMCEACVVASPAWFAESISTASGAARLLYTWDPVAETTLTTQDDVVDVLPPHERHVWTLLHGWLADQLEATDVWHPRALSAASSGVQLVSLLGTVVLNG